MGKNIILGLFLASLFISGCESDVKRWKEEKEAKEQYKQSLLKFDVGDVVKIKVDGRKAIVIQREWKHNYNNSNEFWHYLVRFVNNQIITDTRWPEQDAAIKTLSYGEMWVGDLEIEKIGE
jgi:hypothetical protein